MNPIPVNPIPANPITANPIALRPILVALMLLVTPMAAAASPATDAVFRSGVFDGLPAGQVVSYAHDRTGPAAEGFAPLSGGTITLETAPPPGAGQEPVLRVAITANGATQRLNEFPQSGGNPVLMIFLEDVTRLMAQITGGSPFYIRNRIKDALKAGELTALPDGGQEATFRPFTDDPNADRMGDFAGLVLRLRMDGQPGYYQSLSAETAPGGYAETITRKEAP